MQTKPSIVFVHGIWADGSCFSKVIPMLQAEGYEVMASQHSLDTLALVPTRARRRKASRTNPRSPTSSLISKSRTGVSGCSRKASTPSRETCPSKSRRLSGRTPAADLFNQKGAGTAWRSKPSWYIVAKNDRIVQPELQRFVAKRMGATIHDVDSSHVPMLSNPGLVIDVIRTAADAVGRR